MKKNIFHLSIFGFTFLSFLILFNGCKKMDSEKQLAPINEDIRKKAQRMVDENPQLQNVTYNLNIKGSGFYADVNGNKIEPGSNSYTYQCADAGDIDYYISPVLETLTRERSCSQGFRFKAKWRISVPLPLLATNPNTGALSRGRLRIKNTSGAILFQQASITPVTITDLGDDPATFNTNRLYNVEYTSSWVPFSYFTMDTAPLEHTVWAQTDCEDLPQMTLTVTSPALVSVLDPCNRIEEIGIANATYSGAVYYDNGAFLGYYQLINPCSPPSGATMPDRHEVQIKYVGTGSTDIWRDISPQNNYNNGDLLTDGYVSYPVTVSGTISVHDVYRIPKRDLFNETHGNYLVRYCNVKTGSPNCFGPWSQEFATNF